MQAGVVLMAASLLEMSCMASVFTHTSWPLSYDTVSLPLVCIVAVFFPPMLACCCRIPVVSLSFLCLRPVFLVHLFFFFNDTATTEIYTLSLHDALPISVV